MATKESVDGIYSSARQKALGRAEGIAIGWSGFAAALTDLDSSGVCHLLKCQAESVIDAALTFDARLAESRLLEIAADPEREVPNPFGVDEQESLKTIVRGVLSSVLEAVGPRMPPGWEGSELQRIHLDGAQRAVLGRIDEEYPRLRVDFENRAKAGRRSATRETVEVGESSGSVGPRRKTRRKRVGESPESTRELLASVLMEHHQYDGRHGLNHTPLRGKELAERSRVSKGTASRFLKKVFGSQRAYRGVCNREEIAQKLAGLVGEKSMRGLGRSRAHRA